MVTSEFHQKRQELLLAVSKAPDFYELQVRTAEYEGYVNALYDVGAITLTSLIFFREEGNQVYTVQALKLEHSTTEDAA